jgi:cysteine desulfurase
MPKSNKRYQKKHRKIYLDYASSALSGSTNPGAIHELGVKEKNKLENARTRIVDILSVQSHEIIFTSGATEANNLAILGLIQNFNFNQNFKLPHIITTNIEHSSVLEVFRHLEKTKQAKVTYVEVDENGVVNPKKIKKALNKNTVLVSVMYANNEIGTIQPIQEIAKEIRHHNKENVKRKVFEWSGRGRDPENRGPEKTLPFHIFFHTDATQAINYLPINIPRLGVDLMSFNAAKIYGPKGVGILYIKKNTPINKIMFGGEQEFGLRPGTENVSGAVVLASALEIVEKIKGKEIKRLTALRDYFFKNLQKIPFDTIINGDLKKRLPNNVNITIPNIPSDLLVIELSARGIMASAKSACKAGDGKVSHVIKAINKNIKETDGSIRFSLGRNTTKSDIDYTLKNLFQILTKLKKWYN